MRRRCFGVVLTFLLCIMTFTACAQEITSLPSAVATLCETVYPDYEVAAYSGWGNDCQGQFALVLSKDSQHILCIAEKATVDASYRFAVVNDKALRSGELIPSLLIDTGGDSLFYRYNDGQYSYSYHSVKNEAGVWGSIDLIRYDVYNHEELAFMVKDELLTVKGYQTDEEGNILRRYQYVPVPASWLRDSLSLDRFDIGKFPRNAYEAMVFGGMQSAAALLLPEDAAVLDGCVTPAALSLLANQTDGTRRLFLCHWTEEKGWFVTQSSPLPMNAYIDTVHAWDSIIVEWMDGGQQTGYSFTPRFDGRWIIDYAMAEDWFEINENYVVEPQLDQICYGTFPSTDIRTVDWEKLPRTVEEAISMLDTTGWARVLSDDPDKRLHLHAAPKKDAKSLGMYYSDTAVRVLEEQGEWAHVSVYGIEGWMMKAFLAFGLDMPSVPAHFPALVIRDELWADGIKVYEQPDENADVAPAYNHAGVNGIVIIGVVDDEWFHVIMNDTGMSGFVKQECFWPGNG